MAIVERNSNGLRDMCKFIESCWILSRGYYYIESSFYELLYVLINNFQLRSSDAENQVGCCCLFAASSLVAWVISTTSLSPPLSLSLSLSLSLFLSLWRTEYNIILLKCTTRCLILVSVAARSSTTENSTRIFLYASSLLEFHRQR